VVSICPVSACVRQGSDTLSVSRVFSVKGESVKKTPNFQNAWRRSLLIDAKAGAGEPRSWIGGAGEGLCQGSPSLSPRSELKGTVKKGSRHR
jgi:hypothetical protein